MPKEGPGEAQGKSKEASLVNCPTFLVPKLFCCQASSRPIFSVRGLIFSDVFIVKLPCPNVPPPWPQCFCSQASSRPSFFARSLAFSDVFLVKLPCPNVPPPWSQCFCSQASSRPIFLPEALSSPMFLSSSSLVPMPHSLVPMFLFSSLISSDLLCPRPGLLRSFYCPTSSLPMFSMATSLSLN